MQINYANDLTNNCFIQIGGKPSTGKRKHYELIVAGTGGKRSKIDFEDISNNFHK